MAETVPRNTLRQNITRRLPKYIQIRDNVLVISPAITGSMAETITGNGRDLQDPGADIAYSIDMCQIRRNKREHRVLQTLAHRSHFYSKLTGSKGGQESPDNSALS